MHSLPSFVNLPNVRAWLGSPDYTEQEAFAGKIVQLMGRAWVMMIQAHEHVFFGDVHSGNLMVKISYTKDDFSFVPTWIDFGAAVLRREVFLLQRYFGEKGIPPHSIGIADGGVQGVDDAPGPFSLACSPLCRKSCLTWESRHRCILSAPCPNPNRITNILHKHGARRSQAQTLEPGWLRCGKTHKGQTG